MRSSLAASFLSDEAAEEQWCLRDSDSNPTAQSRAGVALSTGTDPAVPLGRRGAPRLRLSIPARLVTLTDTRRCILVNLSRTGARIGLPEPLHKRAEVILAVAGIDQFGWVVGCEMGHKGGSNGIKFEKPLTDDHVLAMRDYSASFQDHEKRALLQEARDWVGGGH